MTVCEQPAEDGGNNNNARSLKIIYILYTPYTIYIYICLVQLSGILHVCSTFKLEKNYSLVSFSKDFRTQVDYLKFISIYIYLPGDVYNSHKNS